MTFDGLSPDYMRRLWWVIAINFVMFLVEMGGGVLSNSSALQADALDFAGDTATYGLSLLVIGKSPSVRAKAAMLKGISLLFIGLWVCGSTIYHTLFSVAPDAPVMGVIGILALVANLVSVWILMPYQSGDANVRSVWICSRNDAIGNVLVVIAAGAVWILGSKWPDIVVAAIMAALFLASSIQILRQAWKELRIDKCDTPAL